MGILFIDWLDHNTTETSLICPAFFSCHIANMTIANLTSVTVFRLESARHRHIVKFKEPTLFVQRFFRTRGAKIIWIPWITLSLIFAYWAVLFLFHSNYSSARYLTTPRKSFMRSLTSCKKRSVICDPTRLPYQLLLPRMAASPTISCHLYLRLQVTAFRRLSAPCAAAI